MGKSRNGQMSERQFQMLELYASCKSYTEVGNAFGITGSGARENVRVAARLLMRHGENAFPENKKSRFSVEDLISSVPSLKPLPHSPAKKSVSLKDSSVQELSVMTKMGEIVVRVKADENYPGVYIDLKGPCLNDRYEKNTVGLAMVEFEPDKNKIQTVVYGDGNAEDYTHLIEHKNIMERELVKTSLDAKIQDAASRITSAEPSNEPSKKHSDFNR